MFDEVSCDQVFLAARYTDVAAMLEIANDYEGKY
jgi:hypothetical protein